MMDVSLGLTLFVQHGHERKAADFYAEAFGAASMKTHHFEGQVCAVEMEIGETMLTIAGANPSREENPSLGGPYYPKSAGAVNACIQLYVNDIETIMRRAIDSGATVRDPLQESMDGSRVAVVFDPCGHMWSLIQRTAETRSF